MNQTVMKQMNGSDLLSLALYAFMGLGFDAALLLFIDPNLFGVSMNDFKTVHYILHWTIICIVWGFTIWYLLYQAKKKYDISVLFKTKKIKLWQWACIFLCIIISFTYSMYSWKGFKFFIELQKLGLLKFIFQYIYYAFETCLFILIIVFGQQAFELWFHHNKKVPFPYGGLVLAFTWGIVHMLTKGSVETGITAAILSILYGVVFLLLNRNYIWGCIILYFIFIL